MSTHRFARGAALAVLPAALASPAAGQWSSDPAQNLAVAAFPAEQALPQIACTADGGCYVGYFDNRTGNWNLTLQRLDAAGNKQFGIGGLVVSSHPQNSALFGWDMMADSAGNAVLVISDERDGGDLDIHAYRISPAGDFLWGPDGVTLSDNADFEPAPRVTETTDGDFVFVWSRLPSVGDGALLMQRVSPAASLELASGGLDVAGGPGEDPGFADLVPADGGDVIVVWLRDVSTFASPRHVHTQRFDDAGAPQWGAAPVVVFDAASTSIASFPLIRSDGAGGAVYGWYWPTGVLFGSAVQRVSAAGTEVFAHNGVEVSLAAGVGKLAPSIAVVPGTGDILAFWQVKNANQDMWGVAGQKISAAGARLWTDDGVTLQPLDAVEKSFVRVAESAGGAMVFWFDKPTMSVIDARVVGMRVDGTGQSLWAPAPVVLSSVLAGKDDLEVAPGPGGDARLAWQDDRTDSGDVYAQIIQPDGSLGPPAANPADVNGDGLVDGVDLVAVILAWGPCPMPPAGCPEDIDDDGMVGGSDLVQVILNWGM